MSIPVSVKVGGLLSRSLSELKRFSLLLSSIFPAKFGSVMLPSYSLALISRAERSGL